METSWKDSEGASERVRALLNEAGVPLELSVEAACIQFSDAASGRTAAFVDTRQLVYSTPEEPGAYREVDQMLDFYDELEVGSLGIQLMCNVPIECKHRKDVEHFAFPANSELGYRGFPAAGAIAGSQYSELVGKTQLMIKDRVAPSSVASLKIENGSKPQSVHSENLVYNAAGALYDFIAADIRTITSAVLDPREFEALDDLDLLPDMRKIVEANSLQPLAKVRQWAKGVPQELCERYNAAVYDERVYHTVVAYVPVVCTNGPLHSVGWNGGKGIGDFATLDACLVELRKRDWPGVARATRICGSALAPVLLTNLNGLAACLQLAEDWFVAIRDALVGAPEDIVNRWPLESALVAQALEEYSLDEPQMPYRSDLFYDGWE